MGSIGTQLSAREVMGAQDDARQKKADALKLQIAPLAQALAADREKLTAFIDPQTGNPLPDHEKDYAATVDAMADHIGRMRTILGGQSPDEEPNHLESAGASLLDRLHITRDLAQRLKDRQAGKVADYQNQTRQMAGDMAAGVVPYGMTPEGQALAAKTQGEIAIANARPKTTDMKPYRLANGQAIYLDANNPSSHPVGAEPILPGDNKTPKGMKAMEQGGVAFGVMDQDTGKQYLPSQLTPEGDAPPEAKQIWATIQAAQKAKQDAEDKKQKDLWDRLQHSEDFQQRMAALREEIHNREQNLALTSRIPSTEANRYTQAQIIQEQTGKIRRLLEDPSVTKYMGPIAGNTYGLAASFYSPKVRELFAAQKSLSALLPILHGYRGGVQTQKSFDQMSGNMNVDVKAYEGALKAIDDMADSIKNQVREDYPNAPMFSGRALEGPKTKQLRQTQQGGAPTSVDPFAQFGGKVH